MPRTLLRFTLLFTAMGLWLSTSASAFTLRLAPMPTTEPPANLAVRDTADLPTPQFFRFVIAPDGITLALAPIRLLPSAATARLQEINIPDAFPATPQTSQSRPAPLPRYLSGVETLLLRQAQIVGGRQED